MTSSSDDVFYPGKILLSSRNATVLANDLNDTLSKGEWWLTIVSGETENGFEVKGPILLPWQVVRFSTLTTLTTGLDVTVWVNGGLTGFCFETFEFFNHFGPAVNHDLFPDRTPTIITFDKDLVVLEKKGWKFKSDADAALPIGQRERELYDFRYEFRRSAS